MAIILLSSIIALLTSLILYLLIKESKKTHNILNNDRSLRRSLYEIAVLKSIEEKIDFSYSLDKLTAALESNARNLLPISATNLITIKDHKINSRIKLYEPLSDEFIDTLEKSTLSSLSILYGKTLPEKTPPQLIRFSKIKKNNLKLNSYFHIPIFIGNNIQAILTISSTKQNLYSEEDMNLIYQISSRASNSIEKIQELLGSHEAKLTSMLGSLAEGMI